MRSVSFRSDWNGLSLKVYARGLEFESELALIKSFPDKIRVHTTSEGEVFLFPIVNEISRPLFDVINKT